MAEPVVKLLNLVIWGRQKKSRRNKSTKNQVYCSGKYSDIRWHDVRKSCFYLPRYRLYTITLVSACKFLMSDSLVLFSSLMLNCFFFLIKWMRPNWRVTSITQDWRNSLRPDRNQVQKITSSVLKVQHQTPLIFHQTQPHGFHIWANPNSTGVLYLKLAELPSYGECDPFHSSTEGNT